MVSTTKATDWSQVKVLPKNETVENSQLKNADVNVNKYGDDSSQPNQIATPGGIEVKNMEEGVKASTSILGPIKNEVLRINNQEQESEKKIPTTEQLQGKVVMGQEAQQANSEHENYLAMRNDAIASALFNEGKTSKEDIEGFLSGQQGWNESSEEDRANTIESIYKRMGTSSIKNEEGKINEQEQESEKKIYSDEQLFGRFMTGMDVTGIDPITQQALESRSKAVSRLSGIDTSQLADMLTNGQIMSGSQAMRDLKRFDPDKYLALQQQLTKKNQLTSINAVATGGKLATNLTQQMDTALDNGISEILSQNFGDESAVAGEDFANYLGNNARFANYRQQMDNIMGQIGALDTKIENLRKDAIAHLGADVSEYQISSYINVRGRPLEKQRQSLLSTYKVLQDDLEYYTEQEEKKWERDYKERQLALQVMKATKKSGTGSGSGDNSDNIMRYINGDITRNQLGKLGNYTMDDIINVALGVSPQKALKLLKSDNGLSTDMAIVELTKYVYNNGGDNEKVASVLKDVGLTKKSQVKKVLEAAGKYEAPWGFNNNSDTIIYNLMNDI